MENDIIKRNDMSISRIVLIIAVILSVFSQIESVEKYTRTYTLTGFPWWLSG